MMNEPGSPTSGLSSMYSFPKALERRKESARMLESVKEPEVEVLAGEVLEVLELKDVTSARGVPSLLGWAEAEEVREVELGPLEGLREGGMYV
jgi:hypothetical protein